MIVQATTIPEYFPLPSTLWSSEPVVNAYYHASVCNLSHDFLHIFLRSCCHHCGAAVRVHFLDASESFNIFKTIHFYPSRIRPNPNRDSSQKKSITPGSMSCGGHLSRVVNDHCRLYLQYICIFCFTAFNLCFLHYGLWMSIYGTSYKSTQEVLKLLQ